MEKLKITDLGTEELLAALQLWVGIAVVSLRLLTTRDPFCLGLIQFV